MNPLAEAFENLRYQNYACKRASAPHISPQSWQQVYGHVVYQWEARYQAERAINRARSFCDEEE